MRVLQINTETTWRGGERQTLYTMEGLRDAGVECEALCLAGRPLEKALAARGFTAHGVASQSAALRWLAGRRARSFDLLHAQTARGQSLAVLARWAHRRPLLYTRRVNFAPSGLLTRLKYRLTDRTVAISRAIASTLVDIGVPDAEVVSSAVARREPDRDRAAAFVREHGLENRRLVATTGDMVPQKDPATMVETVGRLAAMRDDFVFLHFGNTQMRGQVQPRLDELGLGDVYRVLGHHDRVEDYFCLFDVFLITSNETEGLCSSIFDAFVHRVPVVSTLCGGMHDSVADRGLTCGPREPECLAKQVSRLLDDAELGRAMCDRAEVWAVETVTVPAVTRRYLDIYSQMTRRAG